MVFRAENGVGIAVGRADLSAFLHMIAQGTEYVRWMISDEKGVLAKAGSETFEHFQNVQIAKRVLHQQRYATGQNKAVARQADPNQRIIWNPVFLTWIGKGGVQSVRGIEIIQSDNRCQHGRDVLICIILEKGAVMPTILLGMKITILKLASGGRAENKDMLIGALAEVWREQGHEVKTISGLPSLSTESILFLHVDLSVVPEEYLLYAAGYAKAINGNLKDIRKSVFSQNLVKSPDEWAGPVIVKTDANYGGLPEIEYAFQKGSDRQPLLFFFKRLGRSIQRRCLGEPVNSVLQYPVFTSSKLVPPEWWQREDLVVEKFLPERDNEFYILRKYCFLGSRHRLLRTWSRNPIVSTRTQLGSETVEEPVPHELLELRKRLFFDYGKIDYGMVDGQCVIYDVNKTVGAPGARSPKVMAFSRYLAEGLHDWAI